MFYKGSNRFSWTLCIRVGPSLQLYILSGSHIGADIKPDNIRSGGLTDSRVNQLFSEAEDVVIHGEFELDGQTLAHLWKPAHSTSALHPTRVLMTPKRSLSCFQILVKWLYALIAANFPLHHLAQLDGKQTTNRQLLSSFASCTRRSDFRPKLDIWSIGCIVRWSPMHVMPTDFMYLLQTFKLLVGRWLFEPEDGGENWRLEDVHQAKMVEHTLTSNSLSTCPTAASPHRFWGLPKHLTVPSVHAPCPLPTGDRDGCSS